MLWRTLTKYLDATRIISFIVTALWKYVIRTKNVYLYFSKDLEINIANPKTLKSKPTIDNLVFGTVYSDHMLRIQWSKRQGWNHPRITPLQNFQMHPGKQFTITWTLCISKYYFQEQKFCTMPKHYLKEWRLTVVMTNKLGATLV